MLSDVEKRETAPELKGLRTAPELNTTAGELTVLADVVELEVAAGVGPQPSLGPVKPGQANMRLAYQQICCFQQASLQ